MFVALLWALLVVQAHADDQPITEQQPANSRTPEGKPWKWPETKTINEPTFIFHLLKHKLKAHMIEKIPTTQTTPVPSNCICVPYYQCNANNTIITDGIGAIDVRIRRCTGDLEVCCKLPPPPTTTPLPSTMAQIVMPTFAPTQSSPFTIIFTNPPTMPPATSPPTTTMTPTFPPTTTTTMAPTSPPTTTIAPTLPPTTTMAPTSPPTTTMAPTRRPTMAPTTNLPIIQPTFPPNCVCVPISQCDINGIVIISGAGIINPRQTLNPCTDLAQVCCRLPTTGINFPTIVIPPLTATTTTTTQSLSTTITSSSSCVCVPQAQCDANGYVIVSGAGDIDPRLPSSRQVQIISGCLSGQICCRLPPNGQDSGVGFPSSRPSPLPTLPGPSIDPRANSTGTKKNIGTPNECTCISPFSCADGFVVTNVAGNPVEAIDSRFGPCMSADAVCCRAAGIGAGERENLPTDPVNKGTTSAVNLGIYPINQATGFCGVKGPACAGGPLCASDFGETYFGEFPWMVAILVRQAGGNAVFRCGGSMLNTRAVLTAAHCVLDRPPGVLVARFGEWDTANNNEPLPFQEADVESIVTHPQYYKPGLYYDVAVLILSTPVYYAGNIQPICLPQPGIVFSPGTRCMASGWGKSGFEGKYQTVLKKIDLPLVERNECQSRLQATKLGPYFQLFTTFLCAGGELSKDTCTGDGGGPLVCSTSTGQFMQVGIVSWGIGCGSSNVPAVYTDVAQQRQWIDQQLANYGVS